MLITAERLNHAIRNLKGYRIEKLRNEDDNFSIILEREAVVAILSGY